MSIFLLGFIIIAPQRAVFFVNAVALIPAQAGFAWVSHNNVLADYNLAIHEIASKTRKCFVLDMFNNPYINEYANSRPGVYVDAVHLGKYAHILVAEELEKLILQCIVLNGYPYAKTNLADSWTGQM